MKDLKKFVHLYFDDNIDDHYLYKLNSIMGDVGEIISIIVDKQCDYNNILEQIKDGITPSTGLLK